MSQLRIALHGQSRRMTALALAGIANAVLVLLLNRGYAGMIDAAIAGRPAGIAMSALALAMAALANGAVNWAAGALGGSIAENAGHRMRTAIAGHSLGAECAALESRHSGDSLSRAGVELRQATEWLRGQLCPFMMEIIVLLAAFAAMLAVNWALTAAAFAVVPVIAWYAAKASKPIRQTSNGRQAAVAESNALVKSVLDAFPIVKVFGLKAMLGRKYGASVDRAVGLAVKANRVERTLMTINGLSTLIPLGILLGAGGAMVINGVMTAGVLLAYLNLANYITGPLMNMPNRVSAARAFAADIRRIDELQGDRLESQRPQNLRLQDKPSGNAIELCGVAFAYPGGQPVLKDMDLAVPEGSRVALVGPSGCGKSTVVKLVAALMAPQQGHVFVLGRDTGKWGLAELRRNIAVVLQEPFLFPGSIRENVACGSDRQEAQLWEACRAAGLGELLESLPDGLETDVGERGAKLSGGQRQRVAIARAIAKDAPILLLDEATSALDARTELEVQSALDYLMRGRTVLTITHRLSSVQNADRIHCMQGGRIIESGSHIELMARNGLYASLVRVQAGLSGASPGERSGGQ